MPLNIKNPKAEQLARCIAKESGESLTQAVIIALEERLKHLRSQKEAATIFQEIIKISKRCSSIPNKDSFSPDKISYGNQIQSQLTNQNSLKEFEQRLHIRKALIDSGLVSPKIQSDSSHYLSPEHREELARLFSGEPTLSDIIISERENEY